MGADREIMQEAIKQDCAMLATCDDCLRDDKEFVLPILEVKGQALQHTSKRLQGDREVVLVAVQQYGHALEHASAELRADREVVLAAVRQDKWSLSLACKELRSDEEMIRVGREQVAEAGRRRTQNYFWRQ